MWEEGTCIYGTPRVHNNFPVERKNGEEGRKIGEVMGRWKDKGERKVGEV